MILGAMLLLPWMMQAQQLPNANFEDWSGAAFDGNAQPKSWNASNVEQFGFKFNFAHKEAGHGTGYCMMVQDQEVGAAGITETSPGYFALGQPWAYVPGLTQVSQATAGTYGGINWTYRPDSMEVWIKRTGSRTDDEDFYLLYYSWSGTAIGEKFKNKNGKCTEVTYTNEESDIRQALNGNECGTKQKATQVAEGMWRERAVYNSWTRVRVPILYFNDQKPTMMNIIFSASNYPNFRANSGLYAGNSLYVDDVQLIYTSKIQKLFIGDKEWKGFDPNSTDIQYYSLGESATAIPTIEAVRGAGSITNAHGTTVNFPGRVLSGSEITIDNGDLSSRPTKITVRAEDGSSQTVYQIQFQRAPSSNAKLAGILINDLPITNYKLNGQPIKFNPTQYNYTVDLPYGTTAAPVVAAEQQEEQQTVSITQATSPTGTATIRVTAANGSTKATYTLTFRVAALADNTLKDIKVNGTSVPGFTPTQAVYKVSLNPGTTTMPTVEAISAYPAGEQTIIHTAPSIIDGGQYQISVTTPGNQIAKVYKLNFKLEASSYSYLKSLTVAGYDIHFAPDNTTYYVNLPLGTTTLPQITWQAGDEYQTISMTEGGLDGTTRITVTAGNGDQTVYKIVFSTEKSGISTLNGITVGGTPIADFSPERTSYTFALPVGTTTLPEIVVIPGDEFQTYSITYGGVNGKTRITVTADDGTTTVYQIAFSVATFSDNTLASLTVAGYEIDFAPETNEYWVNLAQGTTAVPEVTYTLQDPNFQTASVRTITTLPGDYKITVRPQSGTSRTYIIHFSVATSANVNLSMIYVGGVALEDFAPETTEYTYHLPEGVSAIPAVTFDKAEASQRVLSVLEGKVQTIVVTAESGAKRTYTITFVVQVSQNAFLDMIYLDGTPLPGFRRDSLTYEVALTGATCPVITVDKAAGQQVTIAAPYAEGVATIKVMPEEGAANTYTIQFMPQAAETARLSDIRINGVSIEGFQPTKMNYTATYAAQLPEVQGVAADPTQTVNVLWKGDVASIYVTDTEGNQAVYSVSFTRTLSSDSTLAAIYADGVLISGFSANVKNYQYELAAGANYPEITYAPANAAQTVFFGQPAEGQWTITVIAENGQTATYRVVYTKQKYSDATLKDLQVDGFTFTYSKTQDNYGPFVVAEGMTLPQVTAIPEDGQSVSILTENDSTQKVLVMAQSGAEKTYTIHYTHVLSNDVALKDIYVDGQKLAGFDPAVKNYSYPLPRTAKVIPNINPIALLDNQTITTYFCRPNGTARIHVVAQDGSQTDYTIAFPVEKAETTVLKSLIINGEPRDVNVTEYSFNVPFNQVEPYDVVYEKEDGQLIHFVEAPLTGVTKIIVTNEKGNNSRTYTVRYTIAQPQGENKVAKVKYSYVDATNKTVKGELEPNAGDNIVNLPFGAKSFTVTEVVKTYAEQAIIFYNGGIRRGAKIIAVANRADEEDVTYTLTPVMPEFETTGKLKTLKFKGQPVPNFRPDVYNYIINVTAQPTQANFEAVAYDNKSIAYSAFDAKKKQVTITVTGGETYSICWYYTGYDGLLDFSGDWVTVSQGVGYKPSAKWTVPGDCDDGYTWSIGTLVNLTYTTGKEVTPGGTNGVMLSTLRGAPMNGSVPGMMTLGEMSVNLKSNGGSTSAVTKNASVGTAFKNTPEAFAFEVKPLSTSNITDWKMWLTMSDGSNYKESNYSGNFDNLNKWANVSVPISYAGVGTVSKFNVMLSSCDQENAKEFGGGTIYESSVMYNNIHFVYNSELTAAKVNGKATTKSGNTFKYTLGPDEVILGTPALKFTGAVHDQMQTIEWLNNGEWVNGKLTARVINYGENSQDSTHYFVVLERTPVTTLDYSVDFGAYTSEEENDTVFVALPYGMRQMPSVTVTPASVHQLVSMSKRGNAVTVTVTAENGADSTMVYVFQETKSNDATPEMWSLESGVLNTVDAENLIYSVEAETMPIVEITKKEGQCVDLNYTADGAVFTMTAADGTTQLTYTINRLDPTTATTGQIDEFTKGGNPWAVLGGDTYAATGDRPTELILFERKFDKDSVVAIQAPDRMEWQVYGSVNHTYVLTYPTSLSSNANLAGILIEGVSYEDFSAGDLEYTIDVDSLVTVEFIGAESAQKISATQQTAEGEIVVYQVTVKAEDNVAEKTYKVTLRYPKSDNATLAGILLDGVMMEQFDPNTFDYSVVLPTPAVKVEQPKMPSITYLAADKDQTVTLNIGELNGAATELFVQAGNGSNNTYTIAVSSAPSACVDLTGILINGDLIDQFEAGRHYYSYSLSTSTIAIDYTSDDRFQTVNLTIDTLKSEQQYRYTLHVRAENGNEAAYEVTVYLENQSNDAQLANILLDGKDMVDFERALNTDLTFDGGNNDYKINLPSGTTVLPEVSAQLKMDGQSVQIIQKKDSILLDVTAKDGVTHNIYTLHFLVPLSKNANLSMIFLNGDSLPAFDPDYYFYQIDLPVGVHTMPEVVAQKGEAGQTLLPVEMDTDKLQATIKVKAEDPTVRENTYVVVFHLTRSDADKLTMIYQDGQPLEGFDPATMYYALSLPVGTTAFPDLSWQEQDDWQTIHMDTVEHSLNNLIRQIYVASESGKKSTYTVSYTIEKSNVDTLQMIFVNQKQLQGFNAFEMEYTYTLTASEASELNGALPTVEYINGDEYQTVLVSQAPDTLIVKSLGYKSLVTVTAATGATRTYTIHYPVEMSSDATLNMILLGGKPISNFDAERLSYREEIVEDAAIPVITVSKKEEVQIVDLVINEDTVYINVTAEDGISHLTYTLIFERRKSDITMLRDIKLEFADGSTVDNFVFRPDVYEYSIVLPYDPTGADELPNIIPTRYNEQQTIEEPFSYVTLENGDVVVVIKVIAPNGDDEAEYSLIFHFTRNNDAYLTALYVNDALIEGFNKLTTEYEYVWPFGSDSTVFITAEQVSYELSDTLAQVTKWDSEGSIFIRVVAQDNVTEVTYMISQRIGADNDNTLKAIWLDDEELYGFAPTKTFYTYYLLEGAAPPHVTAEANSPNAEVSIREKAAGDTCLITCSAADGSELKYQIYFAVDTTQNTDEATPNDVLVKRMKSMQLFVTTTRADVTFALFDQEGHMLFYKPVPIANPNDIVIIQDTYGQDRLNDVIHENDQYGLIVDIKPMQIYFYSFIVGDKKVISSGKIIGM